MDTNSHEWNEVPNIGRFNPQMNADRRRFSKGWKKMFQGLELADKTI